MQKAYWGTLLRLTPLEETEEGKGRAGKDAKRRQGEEGRRGQGRRLGHDAVSTGLGWPRSRVSGWKGSSLLLVLPGSLYG